MQRYQMDGEGSLSHVENRTKGGLIGIWEKEYKNTVTGESFNNMIYPELKGYHGNLYWVILKTTESDFTVISKTPNLFFQLYTPSKPKHVSGGVYPPFPDVDISFFI